jgi:hypothetical protein
MVRGVVVGMVYVLTLVTVVCAGEDCGLLRECVAARVDSTLIYLGRDHMRAERAFRVLSGTVDTRKESNMLRTWLHACAGPDNYIGIGEMTTRSECELNADSCDLGIVVARKMGCRDSGTV